MVETPAIPESSPPLHPFEDEETFINIKDLGRFMATPRCAAEAAAAGQ
jgi:hypothetical protein